MSIIEVQARIATISSRLDQLSPRVGRAPVDPLSAAAFAGSLDGAVQRLGGVAGASAAVIDAAGLGRTGRTAALAGAGLPATSGLSGSGSVPPAAAAGDPTGADVVAAARRYLGVPYRWGGTDPATGFDCSGFTQRVFADLGVDIPRTVAEQRRSGTEVASLAEARPGDLLVYDSTRSPSGRHIGIYLGDGQMIDAPSKGRTVEVGPVWDQPPTTIRRVVPADAPVAAAPVSAMSATSPTSSVSAAGLSGAVTGTPTGRPAWAAGSDLTSAFAASTARHRLPEGLLQAVAQRESGMRTDVVSPAGARGLMQLMPGTAAELGVDPMNPVEAIDGAARYLRQQLDSFGSLDLALAAYNAGPGNVRRHGGVPPFTETQNYVAAITAALRSGGRA